MTKSIQNLESDFLEEFLDMQLLLGPEENKMVTNVVDLTQDEIHPEDTDTENEDNEEEEQKNDEEAAKLDGTAADSILAQANLVPE